VRVTHPFHPLAGREFEFVVRKFNWAEDRVFFFDGERQLRSLPAAWTDVVGVDPFVVVAAGRSPFRAEDLVALADLVERVRPRARRKRVKRTTPAV
jgi:hypothetical protein